MRLSEQQRFLIRSTLRRYFGEGARIWLFGSRVDDARRGGDVDIYVETGAESDENSFMRKIEAGAALEDIFEGAKVDLVVHFQDEPEQPLHRIARSRGAPL